MSIQGGMEKGGGGNASKHALFKSSKERTLYVQSNAGRGRFVNHARTVTKWVPAENIHTRLWLRACIQVYVYTT